MDIVKSFSTPVNYLIDINGIGLVKGAKAQLVKLSLADIILLTGDFTNSKNLNQIGEVKLELIKNLIKETEEYKSVKEFI